MRFSILLAIGLAYAASAPNKAAAQSMDDDARVVELRSSCLVDGSTLDNCFETSADLTDWLWNGGRPSAPNSLDQVLVRVGPGDFDRLECTGAMNGWVSFQGAGREHSHFVEAAPSAAPDPALALACPGGVTIKDCTNLSFSDLSARGNTRGVVVAGDGSTTWTSVDIVADDEGAPTCLLPFASGWYDVNGTGAGLNFFWNTRIVGRGSSGIVAAFIAGSSESWIYSGDILLDVTGAATLTDVVTSGTTADVRMFGTTVRGVASPATSGLIYGLRATGNIHMHGGIVNLTAKGDGSAGPVTLVSVAGQAGGFVHTPETAFVLPGHSNTTRIRITADNPQKVQSPFLWPPSQDPPPIASTDGSDMFVKTNGGASGTESVLYLFDNDCPSPHWRSAADGSCL